ncbi:MAG: diacylglyceryl transferase [Flavobacteriaceae bacterium]|nr:diacylglyceryl transferase [Flavobacteriaceae bacterium]MCY4266445.1 diacylglyceryl transferase [Flavobacteriaceae bacterium]MCY4298217.1 diacylglyceryl transferase [Flavobacteriaceae bacterium]
MKKLWQKLKIRWGIESNVQVFIILMVFAITGMSSIRVGHAFLDLIGITKDNFMESTLGHMLYYTCRVISILIVYKFILIIVGTLFGQFHFFWRFIKRFLKIFDLRRLFH